MSLTIKSSTTSDELIVGTNKAARVELYNAAGNPIGIPAAPLVARLAADILRLGYYFSSTFRILGTAVSPQNIAALLNPAGSGKIIRVRRIGVVMDSTAVLTTVASNVNLSRPAVLPTGGTSMSQVKRDSSEATPVGFLLGGNASDGGAATAITATAAAAMKSLFLPRQPTAVGLVQLPEQILHESAPGEEIILAAGESLLVQSVTANAATCHILVNAKWEEYSA